MRAHGALLIDVLDRLTAFTIMRSVALLQTRSWKLITTAILSALALVLFAADTVRSGSPRTILPSVLL